MNYSILAFFDTRKIVSFSAICFFSLYSAYLNANTVDTSNSYTLFESGQVRPLAMTKNGKFLFSVNTPDNKLEVFKIKSSGLKHCGSISVGIEPVAVAINRRSEVWVVNHLSDSVSVVKISSKACSGNNNAGQIIRTLQVGDEPRDIVFAGKRGHKRAFITTAHRGQHLPFDPQLTTPGIGRADVWVFDPKKVKKNNSVTPLNIITLFTDTPRALTVSADGEQVYAAGFHTGNKTTTIFEHNVLAMVGHRLLTLMPLVKHSLQQV